MARPDSGDIVKLVLDDYGRTFAAEAGIRLRTNTPSPLFRLLCLSMLVSAPIRRQAALSASVALSDAGWNTAAKLAASTWERRTQVLNRSGYARYDESTARYLGDIAELALSSYDGDLRKLREAADGDTDEVQRLLQEFTGIGPVGADVFLREVQVVWTEFEPFVDDRVAECAGRLGLPGDASRLRALVDDSGTFVNLVAGLIRVGLDDDVEKVLDAAS